MRSLNLNRAPSSNIVSLKGRNARQTGRQENKSLCSEVSLPLVGNTAHLQREDINMAPINTRFRLGHTDMSCLRPQGWGEVNLALPR